MRLYADIKKKHKTAQSASYKKYKFAYQVLYGLAFLHEEGVIHRDIKAANILVTSEGVAKLADFGVAVRTSDNKDQDVVGSPYWMAPEVIEMQGSNEKCDIWSVGCTTIELLTGAPPYFDLEPMPALFRIVQDKHPPFPSGFSDLLRDFLYQCFHKDPQMRPDAKSLLQAKWMLHHVSKKVKIPFFF